ncbi:hypothetical protein VM1G_11273 [Cytospora mali]|uniref:Uncharacterized protein n=1 Tax=Cytospora mali TaxID=578113 RepID=A0A194VL44_CYTMA|nr:hypothetical protein VM1G_11273 [Valsa mali]
MENGDSTGQAWHVWRVHWATGDEPIFILAVGGHGDGSFHRVIKGPALTRISRRSRSAKLASQASSGSFDLGKGQKTFYFRFLVQGTRPAPEWSIPDDQEPLDVRSLARNPDAYRASLIGRLQKQSRGSGSSSSAMSVEKRKAWGRHPSADSRPLAVQVVPRRPVSSQQQWEGGHASSFQIGRSTEPKPKGARASHASV